MSKILHIIGDSKYGGASVLIECIAIESKIAGHDVAVLTTDSVFQDSLKKLGIEVIDLKCIWRNIRPMRDILGLVRLVLYLLKERWDIVHTHTSKCGVIGRIAATIARIPTIIHTTHGFAFHEKSPPWHIRLGGMAEKIAAYFCHKIIYVCYFDRDWAEYLRIGTSKKRVVIPNGIPTLEKNVGRIALDCSKQPEHTTEALRCLNIARLVPIKGHKTLVEAASLIKKSEIPIYFEIAGDGPSRDSIAAEVQARGLQDTFNILGFRSDIDKLLSKADIVIQPSMREGLSIVVLEAMRLGKPIIAAAIGSTLEASNYGQAAELFEAGNSKALATAIQELAKDKQKRFQLGQAAAKRFQQYYTEERMIASYLELYSNLRNNHEH